MTAQLENLAAIAILNSSVVNQEEYDSDAVDGSSIKNQIAANEKITAALESEN